MIHQGSNRYMLSSKELNSTAQAPTIAVPGDAALHGAAPRTRPHGGVRQLQRRQFLLRSALLGHALHASAQAATITTIEPDMTPPPHPALPGERLQLSSAGKLLQLYAAGQGAPLLLVHSVNAAASAAEMRPLYAHYQATHTVYAVDLPGFGLSDRSERAYTPRLMTDALHNATAAIAQRHGGQPIDALALSLSCEFLARAAAEAPTHYRSLALVSPTGLAGRDERRGPPESTLGMPWLHGLLRGPGWGGLLFKGLTRPGVIRFFLEKTWGSKNIDEQLWRDAVAMAQQPGAEHAPLAFLSAQMFSRDIQNVYEQLNLPVWLSHGVRGDFTDYRKKTLLEGRPNWRMSVFQTGAMPYFEVPQEFMQNYDAFLAETA